MGMGHLPHINYFVTGVHFYGFDRGVSGYGTSRTLDTDQLNLI